MRFNHLNLIVADLDVARTFFLRHFAFQLQEQKANAITILNDGHGFTLVLANGKAFGVEEIHYPNGFHIGFLQETAEQVDQTYQQLLAEGITIERPPRSVHGTYGFYFTALDGLMIEVSQLSY